MTETALSEFGGVAGRVVERALSWAALVTGATVGFTLLVSGWALSYAGAGFAASLVVQAAIALVLGRFALNGLHGEWRGTFLSSAGGPWSAAAAVGARFLALTLPWSVPMSFAGLDRGTLASAVTAAGLGVPARGGLLALAGVAIALAVATPPPFLVVAVSASSFGETFSGAHWRRTFAGRRADLVALYAAYVGAVAIVLGIAIPVVLLAAALSSRIAAVVALLAGAFGLGVALDLLGRLAGFFAFGPAEMTPADRTETPADVAETIAAPAEPTVAVGPVAAPVAVAAPVVDPATLVERARARFETDPGGAIADLEEARRDRAPHPAVEHALCLLEHRAGRTEDAAFVARTAIPLALARGAAPLATEMFRTCWASRSRLGLDRDALHALAAALARQDDLTYAANTWAIALLEDPRDTRAVKGIMQAAETFLRRLDRPEDAGRLYAYLLRHCPDSPLAEYMHDGLAEARKRSDLRARAG